MGIYKYIPPYDLPETLFSKKQKKQKQKQKLCDPFSSFFMCCTPYYYKDESLEKNRYMVVCVWLKLIREREEEDPKIGEMMSYIYSSQ